MKNEKVNPLLSWLPDRYLGFFLWGVGWLSFILSALSVSWWSGIWWFAIGCAYLWMSLEDRFVLAEVPQ